MVFEGHISTKRGHVRVGRDVTEERAEPKESILAGWFRHRAEKFLSSSVILPRSRTELKTSKGVQGRRTGLLPLTSLGGGDSYTTSRHTVVNLANENYTELRDKTQRSQTDDEFCFSFKLGGTLTWVVFGGMAQRICCSLIADPLHRL